MSEKSLPSEGRTPVSYTHLDVYKRQEISGKEFYLLLTAAEEEREKMLRTADTFQGFFDCLEEPHLRATVFGTGVWHAGEIAGHPALREAYEAGKGI